MLVDESDQKLKEKRQKQLEIVKKKALGKEKNAYKKENGKKKYYSQLQITILYNNKIS
jgi:hypothetical protein